MMEAAPVVALMVTKTKTKTKTKTQFLFTAFIVPFDAPPSRGNTPGVFAAFGVRVGH